jgi:pimeloyl-ACP methyl ester carboxylesterase/DNA-binding CsgD family transcriptional regulator
MLRELVIRYLHSMDGTKLAYGAFGSGPPVLILPSFAMTHLEREWLVEARRAWYERLAQAHTVVRFDYRGSGLSDRNVEDVSLDAQLADMREVQGALGLKRLSIFAFARGARAAVAYAARHPELVDKLILWQPIVRASDMSDNYGSPAFAAVVQERWPFWAEVTARAHLAWQDSDLAVQESEYFKDCSSGEVNLAYRQEETLQDVSPLLGAVAAPTLVVARRDAQERVLTASNYITENMHSAQLALIEGASGSPFDDGDSAVFGTVTSFLDQDGDAGARETAGMPDAISSGQMRLSSRETQILALVARGKHNREIASELGLSNATIERHIANLYAKIGVHTRAEATYLAAKHSLI